MTSRFCALLLPALGCAALLTAQTAERQQGRLPFEQDKLMKDQAAARTPVMIYHGGPVMSASTTTYIVYYGSFTSTQHDILDTFLENLGGSPAFNVNTEYYDSGNNFVQNVLNYNPATNSYDDAYSKGTTLRGAFVTEILHNAVAGGHLPSDVNGIYVLTISPDVKIPANSWCAYTRTPARSSPARTSSTPWRPIRLRVRSCLPVRATLLSTGTQPVPTAISGWMR